MVSPQLIATLDKLPKPFKPKSSTTPNTWLPNISKPHLQTPHPKSTAKLEP